LDQPQSPETRATQRTPLPQPDQRPVPAPTPRRAQRASRKDDLKNIKGIGPILEKKLNAAGVNTYEQFSRLTTTEIQNILGLSKRAVQNADNLITQAKKLAQQSRSRRG
jgi:large subunit ribosomal protein L21